MLAENTGSGKSNDLPRDKPPKKKFSDNFNWQELTKFALAILGFWISAQFLKGTTWLMVIWFFLGLFMVFQVLKMIPIHDNIKLVVRTVLIFGMIAIGVLFLVAGYQNGSYKELLIGVEETGAERAVGTTWEKIWGSIRHPGRIGEEFSDWSNVDVAEEDVKKGIEFFDLRTRRPWFEEGSEIVIYGSAKITSLPKIDTKVTFDCSINDTDIEGKDYDPKGKLTLRGIEGNTVDVYAGHDEEVSFECILNGIPLNLSNKEREDKEEDSKIFKALIEGIYYDFTTTTILGVYNIKKEKYDLLIDPEDSIPDKNFNGKISSKCIDGCGLTTVPLTTDQLIQTEVGSNLLRVILKKDSDWYGNIDRVSKIDVRMPSNFRLIGCEDFGGDGILDESDPYLGILNHNLRDEKYEYSGGRDFSFYCDYDVVEPRDFLGKSDIMVASTYDYKVEGKKTVKIVEKRTSDYGSGNIADPGTGSDLDGDDGEGDTRYYYA